METSPAADNGAPRGIDTFELFLPEDLADRAPEVPILPGMTQTDHMMQLIYGLGRTCPDQRDPVEEFRSFNFCHRPQPTAIASEARSDASDESEDQEQSEDEEDVLIRNPLANEDYLDVWVDDQYAHEGNEMDAWFARFPAIKREPLDELGPLHTQRADIGNAPAQQDVATDESGKSKDKDSKSKDKEDVSPIFACILLANGSPLVPYPAETLQEIGNIQASRFATNIKLEQKLLCHAECHIGVNICYGVHNVQIASITLAMSDLSFTPRDSYLTAQSYKACLAGAGIGVEPSHGAFHINLNTSNQNTAIYFKDRAIQELQGLHMPGLTTLQSRLEKWFSSPKLNITILVTDQWKDFERWGFGLTQVYANSSLDPLKPLKVNSRGQPITVRNYAKLPEDARTLPAKTRFRNVDEMLTKLGDASAREHAYEQWSSRELAGIDCRAVMIPIGPQTCMLKREGQDVEVPYLYSFSVIDTTDDGLFAQLAPPLNAGVKIQVEIPYTKVEFPTERYKSEQEIVVMIGNTIHKDLWNHWPQKKLARDEVEQAWADDYARLIKPYVRPEKFDDKDELVQGFAYMLSTKLQKVRADKDMGTASETPKEHLERTIAIVNRYRNDLKIPLDTTADIPQFTAVRMAHDEPLTSLSDFQFIAVRPKQMGWPKSAMTPPAPFLDFREPRTPNARNHENLAASFSVRNKDRDDKYLVHIRFIAVDDDMTAKSKVQGLIKMKEFQNMPVVEWFTTFKGNPITTNVTDTFSVLRRAMHYFHYDTALPFSEYDGVPTELLHPEPRRNADGKLIQVTTSEFQRRETTMTQLLVDQLSYFSDDQRSAIHMLTKAPFGLLVIEGVPCSGKTTLAHAILRACMYSSFTEDMTTSRQESTKITDLDDDSDSDCEPDDDRYNIKPTIPRPREDEKKDESKDKNEKDEDNGNSLVDCYDIPRLACGPTVAEFQAMILQAQASAHSLPTFCLALFSLIRDTYCRNFETVRPDYLPKSITNRVRNKHWHAWTSEVLALLGRDPDAQVENEPDAAPAVEPAKTTEEILMELGVTQEQPLEHIPCNPQVMIIANQNVNGHEAAKLMQKSLNDELKFDELIIRVTNLDLERKALKNGFRPQHDDGVRHTPGLADFVHMGIDSAKLNAFAARTGDFAPSKHGGIWKIENIMRQRLVEGERPALMRELQRLSNPADIFSQEQMQELDTSIREFMKQILNEARVVICTFVVAQTLIHKELYNPAVVLIEEASREPELLVRWAQTAMSTRLLILTGDYRQDQPFISGRYTRDKDHANVFLPQLLTPLSKRIMTERPDCAVFLSENRRQQGGLHEIASDIIYDGKMRTIYDPRYPSQLASTYHAFAQDLIRKMRIASKGRDVKKGRVAECLTGNRVTLVCNSPVAKRGLSSASAIQARLAVDYAALIHQSQIPGSDGITRPRICIITPYSAQVDEVKTLLRRASPKELCHDLIEVRTQTSATGGEWDVVILSFVSDRNMGFLSETNRINVMLTRSKFLSIDIFDANFFDSPKGHRAFVIRRYKDSQALNGAIGRDQRNWATVCKRCYLPHDKDCRATLKCFFCSGEHHVRNCKQKGVLDPLISPDLMKLAPPGQDAGDAGHVEG